MQFGERHEWGHGIAVLPPALLKLSDEAFQLARPLGGLTPKTEPAHPGREVRRFLIEGVIVTQCFTGAPGVETEFR